MAPRVEPRGNYKRTINHNVRKYYLTPAPFNSHTQRLNDKRIASVNIVQNRSQRPHWESQVKSVFEKQSKLISIDSEAGTRHARGPHRTIRAVGPIQDITRTIRLNSKISIALSTPTGPLQNLYTNTGVNTQSN